MLIVFKLNKLSRSYSKRIMHSFQLSQLSCLRRIFRSLFEKRVYFNMRKNLWTIILFSSTCYSVVIGKQPNNNNMYPPAYFQQHFHDWFFVLGTIQVWRNLNEHHYYYKSMIRQIDTNCSPFYSLNMLPFPIGLESLKLIYYSLISNISKYYFKTVTIYFLFLTVHIFSGLEFASDSSDILFWKIVKPRDHNEIKPPIGKIFRKYKPIRH